MTRYALLLLFFIMLTAPALGLEVSVAPGLSVKNALLYAVVAAIAAEWAIVRNRRFETFSVIVPFATLVGYGFITWLVVVLLVDYQGYDPLETFIAFKSQFADHLIIFLAFFYGITRVKDAVWLFRLLIWIVLLSNIVTVIDGLNVPDLGIVMERRDGRMGGLVGDSNDYGTFVAFFLPAIVALFLSCSRKARPLALIGIVASIFALAITASRGAYVAALGGAVMGTFYLRSYIATKTIIQYSVSLVLVCVVALIVVLNTEYRDLLMDRFSETQTSQVQDLSSGRTAIWSALLERMAENPTTFVTGYGWQAFENANFRYATHNRYLNLLFNLGLIGLFLFLLTSANVIKLARNAIAVGDDETKGFLVAFVFGFSAMLVSLLTSDVNAPWIFIWASSGLAVRIAVETVAKATPPTPVDVRSEIVRHKGPAWQGSMSHTGAAKRLPH